jgi:hypothetical protein
MRAAKRYGRLRRHEDKQMLVGTIRTVPLPDAEERTPPLLKTGYGEHFHKQRPSILIIRVSEGGVKGARSFFWSVQVMGQKAKGGAEYLA